HPSDGQEHPSLPTRRSSDLSAQAPCRRIPHRSRAQRRLCTQEPSSVETCRRANVESRAGSTASRLQSSESAPPPDSRLQPGGGADRKSTRLNSSHLGTSYAV